MKKVTFQILSSQLDELNHWAQPYGEEYVIVIDAKSMYLYSNSNVILCRSSVPEDIYLRLSSMLRRYRRYLRPVEI